jgi:CcmD family protein
MFSSTVRRLGATVAVFVVAWTFVTAGGVSATVRQNDGGDGRPAALFQAGPRISIGNASVREKTEEARLIVSLDIPSGQDVSVTYTTVDGTATAPEDYTTATGVVTVPAGATSTDIVLLIIDDTDEEDTETFTVRLSDPEGGTISEGGESGTVTVVDADPGPNLGYLFAVYIVTWAAFFVYVFMMSRRHRAMRAEIQALRIAITKEQDASDDTD